MRIHLEGQYKHILFKEFTDDYGNQKDVGQDILEELMGSCTGEAGRQSSSEQVQDEEVAQEISSMACADIYTKAEKVLIQKLKKFNDDHTFRYAKIDFLFWYEFQNKCSEIFQKYQQYLNSIKKNVDILES